ncbi:MAG: hypothetical protein ABR579_00765 [Actinomycetota bacterium]
MTRSKAELDRVRALVAAGRNDSEISRMTGISRTTIRDWRNYKGLARPRQLPLPLGALMRHRYGGSQTLCPRCDFAPLDEELFAYLLGMYLGDGCLTPLPRDVYKLRIVCDYFYPSIVGECLRAIDWVFVGDEPRGR